VYLEMLEKGKDPIQESGKMRDRRIKGLAMG
jgi:hypothetical protein